MRTDVPAILRAMAVMGFLAASHLHAEEAAPEVDAITRRWNLLESGDQGQIAAELAEISKNTGTDLGLWQWRARAHRALGQKVQEVAAWKRVSDLDPSDQDAFRAVVFGLADMRAPHRAYALAQQHWDWFASDAQERLITAQVTAQIAQAALPPSPGEPPSASTAKALERLDQALGKPWEQLDHESTFEHSLAAERIVALNQSSRYREAISWADSAVGSGIPLPAHALAAYGNSLAAQGRPGHSLPPLRQAVAEAPFNVPAGMQLYYSLLAAGKFREAERHLSEHRDRQAFWKGDDFMGETTANLARMEADCAHGVGLALARDPKGALAHLGGLADVAPGAADLRVAIAEVELIRGRPRAALQETHHARGLDPALISAESASLRARMQTGEWEDLPAQLEKLQERFPYDIDVLLAQRTWRWETSAFLEMEVMHGTSSAVQSPGKDTMWRTTYRSPGIGEHQDIAVLLDQVAEWGTFPEGDANERRTGATLQKVMKNQRARLTAGAVDGGSFYGGLLWEWQPTDDWAFDARAELNSLQAPVRARRGGTTADFYTIGAQKSWFEDGELSWAASWLSFSDGNDQLEFSMDGRRRVWFSPGWELFAGGALGISRAESAPDTFYFNPSASLAPEANLTLRQQIRGDLVQEATLYGGSYFQEKFPAKPFYGLQYRLEWSVFQSGSVFTQAQWATQPFDGTPERSKEMHFGFTYYF